MLLVTLGIAVGALFVPTARAYALVSCIPTPTPPVFNPVSVQATDIATAGQMSVSNLYNSSQTTKECILDGLVTFLKESLIQNITGSIVDWINNDFEGGPAFVTDPAGFFVNIADETAGNFIETQLGPIGALLCSPFDLQLRLNLWLSTGSSRKQYLGCRLTDIQKNAYEAFTNGGFIANGGWNTFNALTSDPRNNQFGAFIYASDALNTEFIKKANEKLRELSYGRGFLSYKKCEEYAQGPYLNEKSRPCARYKVVTPGSLINNQLNNVFGSELRKIELADEINEVFEALANYGLRQVFSKNNGGLLGASKTSASNTEINAEVNFKRFYDKVQQEEGAITNTFDAKRDEIIKKDPTRIAVGDAAKTVGTSGGQTAQDRNLAIRQVASQSGTPKIGYEADKAVNGDTVGYTDDYSGKRFQAATVTSRVNGNLWWGVKLAKTSYVREIRIYKASDFSMSQSLGALIVTLYNSAGSPVKTVQFAAISDSAQIPVVIAIDAVGQNIQIERKDAADYLYLAEVEVNGTEDLTASSSGSGAIPASGVSAVAPPENTAPIVAFVRQDTTTPEATFTANEKFSGKVRVSLKKRINGVWTPYAFGHDFSSFIATASGTRPGGNPQQKFAETFLDGTVRADTQAAINQPVPYILASNLNASRGTTITITYSFTPDTGASGKQYELTTEFLDSKNQLIAGGSYITDFSVQ